MDILLTSFTNSIIDKLEYLELLKLNQFLSVNDEDIYKFYLNNDPISSFDDSKILNLFKIFKI